MDRRTLLTMSTSACLCGTYALYRMLVSPLVTPGAELLEERRLAAGEFHERGAEKHPQAVEHLSEFPWAAAAKYEIRNDPTHVYFEEFERIEQPDGEPSKQVRFKRFAMIWRPRKGNVNEPPITVVCDAAVVEFAEKFDITRSPGRVVGGRLEGTVRIRGPEGMAIDGSDFFFVESQQKAWSDKPITFAYGRHSGSATGIELELIRDTGPLKEDKPAVSGIHTLRLLKDVTMDLVAEAKDDRTPRETVHVTSDGSFKFEFHSRLATFDKNVRIVRPTGNDQFDKLNCEKLELVFEPKPSSATAEVLAAETARAKESESPNGFGGDLSSLQFQRLSATGPKTMVVSQRSAMQAVMQELTYDEQTRVIALRDAKQVRMIQRNNELRCPEVTALLDANGEIEKATCRGAGKLFRYRDDAENLRLPQARREIEFAAEWLKQLQMAPDETTRLNLIEFSGQAVLSQPEKMGLWADIVRLWVTPDKGGQGIRGTRDQPKIADAPSAKPKKMLALGNAEFASPRITGKTERLEIWFNDGPLPLPPTAGPADRARKHGALRPPQVQPAQRKETGAQASRIGPGRPAVKDLRGATGKNGAARPAAHTETGDEASAKTALPPTRGRRPAPIESKSPAAENPPRVEADLIRVQMFMVEGGDPQMSLVETEGHVHVTQERGIAQESFVLRGDRLRLENYSESHQVIHVRGEHVPAHIHDRGMQLEGADIHLDRGTNLARVEGPGVLRLPVKQGLDGKALDSPQLLDVYWQERMRFDGESAEFFAKVKAKLEGHEMRCEEMQVTLDQRLSFSEEMDRSQETKVRHVICRDGVELKSQEYKENRLVELRTARGFEFALDQETGDITAQGPGTLELWKRGTGNRAGLANLNGVKANRPLKADPAEWEYTRVDFSGRMNGNAKGKTTRFKDRVWIVYGPVDSVTDTIDADELPLNGGWMRCEELDLTQIPGSGSTNGDSMAVVGRRNAELVGHSEYGRFHAQAGHVSFDGSKGLYSLFGGGGHDASLHREDNSGKNPSSVSARRMEFIPSRNFVNIQETSGAQGGR